MFQIGTGDSQPKFRIKNVSSNGTYWPFCGSGPRFGGTGSVATGDQSTRYRHYASECLRLAQLAPSSQNKDLLLQMAETWRRLAEQAESSRKPDPD